MPCLQEPAQSTCGDIAADEEHQCKKQQSAPGQYAGRPSSESASDDGHGEGGGCP